MPTLSPENFGFSSDDLEQITAKTFVRRVDFHRELPSTNDRALELADRPQGPFPLLVLAERQTKGRGRGANVWWAEPGALTFTLLLEAEKAGLAPRRWPQVSMTAGLAVCEAIEDLLESEDVQIKWPNDVYLQGRKVCGILAEAPGTGRGMLVLGMGVNVNNLAVKTSPQLQGTAISLGEAVGRQLSLTAVLIGILERLAERLDWIGSQDEELRRRWRRRCLLTGRTVHLDLESRRIVGVCRGIDDDGALVLQTTDGAERFYSGVISQFG